MRLRLSSRGIELSAAERERIERMLRQTLSRHASLVAAVTVTLLPSPRMHGSELVWCRIRTRQRNGRSWIVEEHAAGARQSAFGASARVEGRLDRERGLRQLDRPSFVLAR